MSSCLKCKWARTQPLPQLPDLPGGGGSPCPSCNLIWTPRRRAEKLPAFRETDCGLVSMKKKINRILFSGYHSVLWGTLCNEKKTGKKNWKKKGLLNKWYWEHFVAIMGIIILRSLTSEYIQRDKNLNINTYVSEYKKAWKCFTWIISQWKGLPNTI